jgi:DMSO/TMAO reductase YedYZ heme-binding membrane subunit
MTAALAEPIRHEPTSERQRWLTRPLWRRFTPLQLVVLALAAVPPALIAGATGAHLLGFLTQEALIDTALAAGEEPGMLTFAAMFLASPVQWLTGRSQIRVRKFLGIVFFLLALSNGAMFVLESGIAQTLSEPFLVAGTFALALAAPLFATSSRWSQRTLGMRRWRVLHKLTYVVATALVGHIVLMGEFGFGSAFIIFGFIVTVTLSGRAGPPVSWVVSGNPCDHGWVPSVPMNCPKLSMKAYSVS